VIGIGFFVGWLGSRAPATSSQAPEVPATQAHVEPGATTPAPHVTQPAQPAPHPAPTAPRPAPVVVPADTNAAPTWEDKVDDILGAEMDDTNRVQLLFAMFPTLPEDGQVEVAEHLSNLVPDENYAPLAQMLENSKLPEPVLDVLMGDILNRPNSIKLPTLLQVANDPTNPKAAEAKDLMELYLDEEDPAKWPAKLPQWLKDNPD
jgi:hypothetical protein